MFSCVLILDPWVLLPEIINCVAGVASVLILVRSLASGEFHLSWALFAKALDAACLELGFSYFGIHVRR